MGCQPLGGPLFRLRRPLALADRAVVSHDVRTQTRPGCLSGRGVLTELRGNLSDGGGGWDWI